MEYKIGDKIKVKDNAFPKILRGKQGKVVLVDNSKKIVGVDFGEIINSENEFKTWNLEDLLPEDTGVFFQDRGFISSKLDRRFDLRGIEKINEDKLNKIIKEALQDKKLNESQSCKIPSLLNENLKHTHFISEQFRSLIDSKKPLIQEIKRINDVSLIREARILFDKGILNLPPKCQEYMNTSDFGKYKLKEGKIILEGLIKEQETQGFKICYMDYGDEEVLSNETYSTEQEAENSVQDWEENYYGIPRYKMNDYDASEESLTRTMYYNPDDKENYFGYKIVPSNYQIEN